MFEIICQIILYIVFAFTAICTLCFTGVIMARFVVEAAKELTEIKDEFLVTLFEKKKKTL